MAKHTYFTARLFEFPINFLNEVFEFSAIIQYFRYYVRVGTCKLKFLVR